MSLRSEPAGSIYDLGYRNYDGVRLGRRHAFRSLYGYSLRASFGMGRRATSKVIPWAIVVLALAPTLGQLAVAAIAPVNVSVISPANYFDFVQITLALFCAAVGPELFARDQRMRTLPLYFSRGLKRNDYTIAKLAALVTALLFITLLPQTILFFGNGMATNHLAHYFHQHWVELPQILASGVIVAVFFAGITAAIGSQTPRRAYATVAILAVFVLSNLIAGVIDGTVGGGLLKAVVLLTPFDAATGTIRWIFNVHFVAGRDAGPATPLMDSGLPMWSLFPALIGVTAIGAWITFRRFLRLAV